MYLLGERCELRHTYDSYECITALQHALRSATRDMLRVVDVLMESGVEVKADDMYGRTPLHVAVHYDGFNVVNALLTNISAEGSEEKSCMVNLLDYSGNTALHLASRNNSKEVVSLLLSVGAKVGIKNNKGETALHIAARASSKDVVNVLLDSGEDVNATSSSGDTPLHIACFNENEEAVRLMLCMGAKLVVKNKEGMTPLQCAMHNRLGMPYEVPCSEIKNIEKPFITQVIRLKMLGLQDKFDIDWRSGPDFYDNVRTRCCKEIKNMKSTMVVKDISLYQVLTHTNQPFLLSTEDLLHIDDFLSSPDLLTRFPLYGDTLRITFQRAKLLTQAVESFYSERRKERVEKLPPNTRYFEYQTCYIWSLLPREVAEQVLGLLNNKDLRSFIESE